MRWVRMVWNLVALGAVVALGVLNWLASGVMRQHLAEPVIDGKPLLQLSDMDVLTGWISACLLGWLFIIVIWVIGAIFLALAPNFGGRSGPPRVEPGVRSREPRL